MDVEHRGGPLCFSRVIPVPALVLPEFPDDSGHRCVRPPMAECQSVCVSANKADSGSTMQSKGEQCLSPSHSPILALPDLVLGANSPLVSVPLGDSDQARLAVPASGQDLASSTRALEVVGMAHTGPRAMMDILPVEVQETIASARAPATRKLYIVAIAVGESWMRSPWGDIGWSLPLCVESDGLGRFFPRQFLLGTCQSSSKV